jgi:hypothetical protein
VISAGTITKDNLFVNGLNQNIIILCHMFEAMGLQPIILMSELPGRYEDLPECVKRFQIITCEDIAKMCLQVNYFLEIGMSIDMIAKNHFRMLGVRIIKVYLGNILNIDTETPLFYPATDFPHHVATGNDAIFVSPHYGQNAEYAVAINYGRRQLPENSIAPYVWDPLILSGAGCLPWRPRTEHVSEPIAYATIPNSGIPNHSRGLIPKSGTETEEEVLIIMEPNISFQKSSIVPLLAVERWYKQHREWKGRVVLFNADRLTSSRHFETLYYKRMTLFADKKVDMVGRMELRKVCEKYPYATFMSHQVNNEFNYMFLELVWNGYPVVHNVETWKEFGYYYPNADLDSAAGVWRSSLDHKDVTEIYKGHARILAWRYSPYNPAIQSVWAKLLEHSLDAAAS